MSEQGISAPDTGDDQDLRVEVRRLLSCLLVPQDRLLAFIQDHFLDVHREISPKLSTTEIHTFLLDHVNPYFVRAALQKWKGAISPDEAAEESSFENQPNGSSHPESGKHKVQVVSMNKRLEKLAEERTANNSPARKEEFRRLIKEYQKAISQLRSLHENSYLDGNRYHLFRRLGSGGFGEVWLAHDRVKDALVAIKVLHGHLENQAARERFYKGTLKMANLSHQNIIQVLSPPTEKDGYHYFVMKYIPGRDLYQEIKKGNLDTESSLGVIVQIGRALDYAHVQGCMHRDVKPGNIIIDKENRAYLTDFDLAGSLSTTGKSRNTGALGTYDFSAPEQKNPDSKIDKRADIYSLGMTMLFVVNRGGVLKTGFIDHRKKYLDNLKCSPALRAIILKATATEPNERYQSMGDFCHDVEQYINGHKETSRTAEYSILGLFIVIFFLILIEKIVPSFTTAEILDLAVKKQPESPSTPSIKQPLLVSGINEKDQVPKQPTTDEGNSKVDSNSKKDDKLLNDNFDDKKKNGKIRKKHDVKKHVKKRKKPKNNNTIDKNNESPRKDDNVDKNNESSRKDDNDDKIDESQKKDDDTNKENDSSENSDLVEKYLSEKVRKVQSCFPPQTPIPEKLVINYSIKPNGQLNSELIFTPKLEELVQKCVVKILRRAPFPKGVKINFTYTYEFPP